jgi:hypothetical protein
MRRAPLAGSIEAAAMSQPIPTDLDAPIVAAQRRVAHSDAAA